MNKLISIIINNTIFDQSFGWFTNFIIAIRLGLATTINNMNLRKGVKIGFIVLMQLLLLNEDIFDIYDNNSLATILICGYVLYMINQFNRMDFVGIYLIIISFALPLLGIKLLKYSFIMPILLLLIINNNLINITCKHRYIVPLMVHTYFSVMIVGIMVLKVITNSYSNEVNIVNNLEWPIVIVFIYIIIGLLLSFYKYIYRFYKCNINSGSYSLANTWCCSSISGSIPSTAHPIHSINLAKIPRAKGINNVLKPHYNTNRVIYFAEVSRVLYQDATNNYYLLSINIYNYTTNFIISGIIVNINFTITSGTRLSFVCNNRSKDINITDCYFYNSIDHPLVYYHTLSYLDSSFALNINGSLLSNSSIKLLVRRHSYNIKSLSYITS